MRTDQDPIPSPILDVMTSAAVVRVLADSLSADESCAVTGAVGSSTAFLAAAVAQLTDRPVFLVVAHPDEADEAVDELTAQGVVAARLPALELSPGETQVSLDLFAERLRVVRSLGHHPPDVLIAPVHAIMQLAPAPDGATDALRTVRQGDALAPADLVRWLDSAGYNRVDAVEDVGQFALRGGIIDLFPPSSAQGDPVPIRLDFFGDELDSICEIDPDTMGSDRALNQIEIVSASAKALPADLATTPITTLLGNHWLGVLLEPVEIIEQARGYFERVIGSDEILSPPDTLRRLRNDLGALCEVSQYAAAAPDLKSGFNLPVSNLPMFAAQTHEAITQLTQLAASTPTIMFCQNQGEMDRLTELINESALPAPLPMRLAYIHRGFVWGEEATEKTIAQSGKTASKTTNETRLAVVPNHELLNRYQMRRRGGRLRVARSLDVFLDLQPGDYAVHLDHGLCRFVGLTAMKRRDSETNEEEFLTLEFARTTTLHVPMSQIDKVQRYVGGFHGKPKLSTLGSKRWKSQKEKVAGAVHDLAGEMLRVQAARAASPGLRYPADTAWQTEFEAEFPYDETEDQLTSIAQIKRDMHSPRPMDRLLCGDVGYGKTELGIRAAFKAAEFGKQVAVLVPTTILAEQHERTFRDRFADYPFRVESLSRFKTPAEQKTILKDLAAGRVDIVIGTHRLLSKDVAFADLGLVLIDEEQRFGVEHKQRLLSLRMMVDVLTLSATPIPRTLHLSLLGLRDISSLTTAPADRRSVVTEVIPFNRNRIQRALARELARGGQVYFVHNRVKSIQRIADEVRRLAPKARIVVGHGQMPTRELERIMFRFVRRQADILVCTTIIESGVDIPTANTMIITDADRFGLADLHQLRGRVGRYKHRAYCYLLLPENRPITTVAKRRLKAIEEFSMLGAGFKIAMRDLEIRGAGNLLGAEQSGHIAAVGYEMYCRLLENAVKTLKNETTQREPAETVIDLGIHGLIPAAYIPSVKRRIEAYRRLATARSLDDLEQIQRDIEQAYGALPRAADRLVQLAELRISASAVGIHSMKIDGADVVMRCADPLPAQRALQNAAGTVRMIPASRPGAEAEVFFRPPPNHLEPTSLLNILRARLKLPETKALSGAGIS